ncbi:MAG: DUF5320 domain-containing protein [Candidatus Komeilibacteria bacterium]
MPNRDGTGPTGKGPMTGRGLGNCRDGNANTLPQRANIGRGRNMGIGRRVRQK